MEGLWPLATSLTRWPSPTPRLPKDSWSPDAVAGMSRRLSTILCASGDVLVPEVASVGLTEPQARPAFSEVNTTALRWPATPVRSSKGCRGG